MHLEHNPDPRPDVTGGRGEPDLEIIIPALNEEFRLPGTLSALLRECDRLGQVFGVTSGIVVVDNGSSDRTGEVADRFAESYPGRVSVLGCATRGKGAAVRRGVLTSKARFVGFVDADLAVPAEALHSIVDRFVLGADVVIASRRCEGASYAVRQSVLRRTGGFVFRQAIRDLIPGVQDSQCGFKFFRLDAARRMFGDLSTRGFSFDVELLVRALSMGYSVTEIPVTWTDGAESSLSPLSHGGQIAREVLHLRRMSRELAQHVS